MTKHVMLNNVDHKDLRIATGHGAHLGDNVMLVPTFPAEFRNLQSYYPIVFRKGDDGSFEAVALLGFQEGENLFLDGARWDAAYMPMLHERQPFLIGVSGEEMMINIDLDHPRVRQGGSEGEAVFLPHGGSSEFLDRANSLLMTIHQHLQACRPFMNALVEHELLESFVLDVELSDGSQNRLMGFYAINEDKLAKLDDAAVARLYRTGYLQAIYMAVASLSQFRQLIERKNRSHAGRPE